MGTSSVTAEFPFRASWQLFEVFHAVEQTKYVDCTGLRDLDCKFEGNTPAFMLAIDHSTGICFGICFCCSLFSISWIGLEKDQEKGNSPPSEPLGFPHTVPL